jgi:hypothetical protein
MLPVTYPQGEKVLGFHVPVTVDDCRALYRAYLEARPLRRRSGRQGTTRKKYCATGSSAATVETARR